MLRKLLHFGDPRQPLFLLFRHWIPACVLPSRAGAPKLRSPRLHRPQTSSVRVSALHAREGTLSPPTLFLPVQKQLNENIQNSPPPSQRPYSLRCLPYFLPLSPSPCFNCIPILLFESRYDYPRLSITRTLPPIHADDKTMTTTIMTTAISTIMSVTSSVNESIALTRSTSRFPCSSVWP